MQHAEILAALIPIFRNIFDNEAMELTPDTVADDIADWDSMANITLAVEVEERFGIKIRTAEMEEVRNVGDLIRLVDLRLQRGLILT